MRVSPPLFLPLPDLVTIAYLWLVNRAQHVEAIGNQMMYLDDTWVSNFVKSRRVLDKTMRRTTMMDVLKMVTKGTGIQVRS